MRLKPKDQGPLILEIHTRCTLPSGIDLSRNNICAECGFENRLRPSGFYKRAASEYREKVLDACGISIVK